MLLSFLSNIIRRSELDSAAVSQAPHRDTSGDAVGKHIARVCGQAADLGSVQGPHEREVRQVSSLSHAGGMKRAPLFYRMYAQRPTHFLPRFVHLSPSDIPLYDPVTFHYQLMSESLSRTSACVSTSLDLYRWNSAMTVRPV